ncbi:pullulanase [candidate division KSB1 bacterium]|nr:pullulanase [candidate division KSB1 bacterium]
MKITEVVQAKIQSLTTIQIVFSDSHFRPEIGDIEIRPQLKIIKIKQLLNSVKLITEPLDLTLTYYIKIHGFEKEIQPDGVFQAFKSEKELGCTWNHEMTLFRVFVPRAQSVLLELYKNHEGEPEKRIPMTKDKQGVWEASLAGHYFGYYYGYRVKGPTSSTEQFDADILVGDPYSRAVVTANDYTHPAKTLIMDMDHYDWQGDQRIAIAVRDLVIYECHLRDMSAHPSSGMPPYLAGSYRGFIERALPYIKSLGVNAVEFLPIQEFANLEIPYGFPVNGKLNSWNPYERNHWGYMTSYFFTPESYYAGDASLQAGQYLGTDGRQVHEFRDVVKALHREGIAVILDVVFNHTSEYDYNCFKFLDKKYYFRLDDHGEYLALSGCGNDFKTERPMSRRFILDCLSFWVKEYHIDGFRFDLAAMIDWETIDSIREMMGEIDEHIVLIAEPWGGGKYEPRKFSQHQWAAWNDHFRNGVKGQNPVNGTSYIFGSFWQGLSKGDIKRFINGTLEKEGGLFQTPDHCINYLASHDDHNLGDFIRIGCGKLTGRELIQDLDENVRLTEKELKIQKLAACILFTSQGGVMISQGQEYGHSKVIAPSTAPDSQIGTIDHNSYNKDNETNWLNYHHIDINIELVEYYRHLAYLRKNHVCFRQTAPKAITWLDHPHPMVLGYLLPGGQDDPFDWLVLLNGSDRESAEMKLPTGAWEVVADHHNFQFSPQTIIKTEHINLPSTSAWILRRSKL